MTDEDFRNKCTELLESRGWYMRTWYGSWALVTSNYLKGSEIDEAHQTFDKKMDEEFPLGHLAMVKDGSIWDPWFIGHHSTRGHRGSDGTYTHVGIVDIHRGGESWSSDYSGQIVPVWRPSQRGGGWDHWNAVCKEFYASDAYKEFKEKYE